jgi:GT2 family glycosyltransferase
LNTHLIVVTWQGAHLIGECLRALLSQRGRKRVVVVDNGSTDGTAEIIARDFPGIEVLRLPENLGYGRANNEAIRRALHAGAPYLALVNNDVELDPGWLEQMLRAADEHAEAGLFCGTLLFQGQERVNSTGIEIDALGRARDRDFGLPLADLKRGDGPVESVTGGAAFLRSAALEKIGLFDPAYFAYYEDVDLSFRARRAGIQCWYVRGATARHRFAATLGADSPRQRYLLGVGHLRTVALHQPLLKAAALVPLTIGYRAAVKAPLELLRSRPSLAWAELRAAAQGGVAALRAFSDRSRRRR